jgi:hypothetical protein
VTTSKSKYGIEAMCGPIACLLTNSRESLVVLYIKDRDAIVNQQLKKHKIESKI